MKRTIYSLLISITFSLIFIGQSYGFDQGNGFLCVNDTGDLAADFQAALDKISPNNRPDSNLRLTQGTYVVPNDPNGHFNV